MRVSPRLLLVLGLLVANCLAWSTSLLVCGGYALGNISSQTTSPSATAVVQATGAHRTSAPRLSPSPISTRTPRPTFTPAPTTWIVNPTASWATLSPPPPTPTRPTSTPTPSTGYCVWPMQVIQGSDAEAKVQALMELAAKGPDIPFQVVFTEREIEQQIERYLAQQPEAPYRNVAVTLKPGDAVVSGQVNVSGLWVAATVHADVTARDGKLLVTITQVNLGPIPLPGRVKEDLTEALTDALVGAEYLPFRFTAITLGTGHITIQGVTE